MAVTIAGLVDGNRTLLLVQHPGISRASLWSVLERRWPNVMLCYPGYIAPSSVMTVQDAAALACRRRGIDPIRIVVMPQVIAITAQADWDEPMPMLF